jgi:hypothetical protein
MDFLRRGLAKYPRMSRYTVMLDRARTHERAQRASPAWIPYLADVNTIVFHVPISAFDERLDEDRHINRLGDCFRVWTMICKSKLIAKVFSSSPFVVVLGDAADSGSDRCN